MRRGRRQAAAARPSDVKQVAIQQSPFAPPQNNMAPLQPLSDDQIFAIHENSLRIISEIGIEVMSDKARALYREMGGDVDDASQIVRLDPDIVLEKIALAPSKFTLTPWDSAHSLTIGGNQLNFGMVSGAPNVHDAIHGRRSGNLADYTNFIKLGQSFNTIHFFGNQTLAPNDLPVNTRHLTTNLINLTHSSKIFLSMSIGKTRVLDTANMLAIARGLSVEALADSPSCITNISINSPRKFDTEMADAAIALAELGQAVVVTPFTLMGAMTPVTLAAALAQQNAEALFAIALLQHVRAGTPVVYGGFTSNVDMKSGAPAFGTPENSLANMAGGQLARHYKLPYRTSACSASNTVDAQAVWETQMALWGAATGHGNMIYHAAGWGEGGLVASYEKLVVDCEMLQAMTAMLQPIQFEADDFGFEAIKETLPGGHFFGSDHTLARYQTAFYSPFLSNWQSHENWQQAGAKGATERATDIWQDMLAAYEMPGLAQDRVEALEAYVAKRCEEIGSSDI